METEQATEQETEPGTIMTAEKIIEFDHVVAGYSPSLTILNETTLDARRGEITLLIGPNGAGMNAMAISMSFCWPYDRLPAGRWVTCLRRNNSIIWSA